MDEKEVSRERLGLKEKQDLLSPPYLAQPYQCSKTVTVYGFVPHATIDIEVGAVVVSHLVEFPEPVGATLPLPTPLVAVIARGETLQDAAQKAFQLLIAHWESNQAS